MQYDAALHACCDQPVLHVMLLLFNLLQCTEYNASRMSQASVTLLQQPPAVAASELLADVVACHI